MKKTGLLLMSIVASCSCTMEYIPAKGLLLDHTELILEVGSIVPLQTEVSPENATSAKFIEWNSSDSSIAEVDETGNVTAIAPGKAEIMAQIANTLVYAYCEITVTEKSYPYYDEASGEILGYGVNINGTIWAPVNCGFHPTDYPYGKLYQWGRSDGQGYSSTSINRMMPDADEPAIENTLPKGSRIDPDTWYFPNEGGQWMSDNNDNDAFAETVNWNDLGNTEGYADYEGVGNPCPKGWKVPSFDEWVSLLDGKSILESSSFKERDGDSPMGLSGRWFGPNHRSATILDSKGCIFLPCAGERDIHTGNPQMREGCGGYWCSTSIENDKTGNIVGNLFYFEQKTGLFGNDFAFKISYGYAVRCVKDL